MDAGAYAVTHLLISMPAAQKARQTQQIPKHAASGYFGARTRPLHDQRIGRVTLRLKLHDVVRKIDVAKRVIRVDGFQPDGRRSVSAKPRNVAQVFAVGRRFFVKGKHIVIIVLQARQEFIDAAVAQRLRHQVVDRKVANPDGLPEFTRKNRQFSRDIHPRQVIARIRLGIAALLRLSDDLGKRRRAVVDIEEVGQRARKNTAN